MQAAANLLAPRVACRRAVAAVDAVQGGGQFNQFCANAEEFAVEELRFGQSLRHDGLAFVGVTRNLRPKGTVPSLRQKAAVGQSFILPRERAGSKARPPARGLADWASEANFAGEYRMKFPLSAGRCRTVGYCCLTLGVAACKAWPRRSNC